VQLGANMDALSVKGETPLHYAANHGHVEVVKTLAQLGANKEAKTANGFTPLQISVRLGYHQVTQVLRELESTARAQKAAAARARARKPAQQDTPEAREAAERMAAELIEEEERELAAQRIKGTRGSFTLAPHQDPHRAFAVGERCVVFLSVARVSAFPLTAWYARGMGCTAA
jgi:hypothetical protein